MPKKRNRELKVLNIIGSPAANDGNYSFLIREAKTGSSELHVPINNLMNQLKTINDSLNLIMFAALTDAKIKKQIIKGTTS